MKIFTRCIWRSWRLFRRQGRRKRRFQRLAAGEADAAGRLIEGNLKKVLAYAREYEGKGLPMNDLVQEANMALTALAAELSGGLDEEPERSGESAGAGQSWFSGNALPPRAGQH